MTNNFQVALSTVSNPDIRGKIQKIVNGLNGMTTDTNEDFGGLVLKVEGDEALAKDCIRALLIQNKGTDPDIDTAAKFVKNIAPNFPKSAEAARKEIRKIYSTSEDSARTLEEALEVLPYQKLRASLLLQIDPALVENVIVFVGSIVEGETKTAFLENLSGSDVGLRYLVELSGDQSRVSAFLNAMGLNSDTVSEEMEAWPISDKEKALVMKKLTIADIKELASSPTSLKFLLEKLRFTREINEIAIDTILKEFRDTDRVIKEAFNNLADFMKQVGDEKRNTFISILEKDKGTVRFDKINVCLKKLGEELSDPGQKLGLLVSNVLKGNDKYKQLSELTKFEKFTYAHLSKKSSLIYVGVSAVIIATVGFVYFGMVEWKGAVGIAVTALFLLACLYLLVTKLRSDRAFKKDLKESFQDESRKKTEAVATYEKANKLIAELRQFCESSEGVTFTQDESDLIKEYILKRFEENVEKNNRDADPEKDRFLPHAKELFKSPNLKELSKLTQELIAESDKVNGRVLPSTSIGSTATTPVNNLPTKVVPRNA